MKKEKIYDSTLINSIRNRAANYERYISPQVDVTEYSHMMENPSGEIFTPDEYGVTDHVANAFYDWNLSKNQTNIDTELGDFLMADEDIKNMNGAKQYIELTNELNKVDSDFKYGLIDITEHSKQVQRIIEGIEAFSEAYNKVANGELNDKAVGSLLSFQLNNGKIDEALINIEKQVVPVTLPGKTEVVDKSNAANRRIKSLYKANNYKRDKDYWDSKLVSTFYRSKKEQPGMDLTDIDTYLYKLPGLLGSSASTIGSQMIGYAGSILSSARTGGPIGIIVTAGSAVAANLYARDQESKAEVYSNYKSKLQKIVNDAGLSKEVLDDARNKMKDSGKYTFKDIKDDNFVYDQLISGEVASDVVQFRKLQEKSLEGIRSLYMDNMALSASDVAQQAIEVVPIGRMAKSVKGLGKIGKAVEAGEKLADKYGNIKQQLSSRIDDIVSFGLDNVNKLPKATRNKAILDLGGRILISSALEGQEEGVQYIKGQRFIDGDFDPDPNLVKSFIKNIGTGARSIYAAITPWDPVYSDDKEFLENFKGGALLGGLTTSIMGGITTIKPLNDQITADQFVASLYADKMYAKDRVRKNLGYIQQIKNGTWEQLNTSFDNLAKYNIEGLDPKDIADEKIKAELIRNAYTSKINQAQAAKVGIDPRTNDYATFIALKEYHESLVSDARKNISNVRNDVEQLLYSPDTDNYINSLVNENVDANTIRELIATKSKLEVGKQLIEDFNTNETKLKQIEKNTNLSTSRADLLTFSHILSKNIESIQNTFDNFLKELPKYGLKEEQLEVPNQHQSMADAYEKLIAAELDLERAMSELDIMNSTNSDAIKAKINKWNRVEINENKFVQDLNDIVSGRKVQKAEEEAKEVQPEPIKQQQPQINEEQVETEKPAEAEVQPKVSVQQEITEAYNDFISSGEWYISQKVQEKYKDRSEQVKKWAEDAIRKYQQRLEEQERAEQQAQEQQNKIKNQEQEKVFQQNKTTPVQEQTQTPQTPIVDPNKLEPAKVEDIPTLGEILGDLVGDQSAILDQPAIEEQPPVKPAETAEEYKIKDLTYDQSLDPYSHELLYRLTEGVQDKNGKWTRIPKRFQGMEQYLNNAELSEVSANADFIPEVIRNGVYFVVRDYYDKQGNKDVAIYAIFKYKGKEYAAAVKTVKGLQARSNTGFNSLPYKQQEYIKQNLTDLRNKILELNSQLPQNPNLRIVPTFLKTTTGRVVNEKNAGNTPKNRSLIESKWQEIKDPYKINPDNTEVGVTTGPLGNSIIRFKNRILSAKGFPMGKPVWNVKVPRLDGGTDSKLVILNYKYFKDSPKVASLILDLVLSNSQFYTDANGLKTNINPKQLLDFLVNFGPQTAINPNNSRLDKGQIQNRITKQFYQTESGDVVLGNQIYNLNDLLTNSKVREQAEQYIMNNFHYNIDEDGLNRTYLGGDFQSKNKDPHFQAVGAFLKNSNADKIVLIPNELEFSLKDFGLTKDEKGNVIKDQNQPDGISVLGWYIKQGVLLTDIGDNLQDANIYVDDVRLQDITIEQNQQQAQQKIDKELETPEYDVFTLPDATGKQITIDMADIYAILDGKKRNGANMSVEVAYNDKVQYNAENLLNEESATEWLQSKLNITPEITQSVIDVTETGMNVVGRATEDSILLYEGAPQGAEFHEAWHRVSQLLIDEKRRRNIFDRYSKRKGLKLSDAQIDEMLAEEFRSFMLEDASKFNFDTKNWFRRIYDFIRLWARTGQYGLARIYSDINRAKFYGITPDQNNVQRFKQIYGEVGPNLEINGYNFKHISTYQQFDDITKSLTYAFFRTDFANDKTVDYKELATNKPNFERLKLVLQAQAYKFPSPVINEIVEVFDNVYAPTIASRLKQLGIRTIDKNEEQNISDIEEGSERVNIGQHTVEGMNISIQDNAPAEVKFFFQTIPLYEIGQDGQPHTKFDEYTKFPRFVDPKKAWDNILKNLAGCRTISNIMDKVSLLAKNDPFYQSLLVRLTSLVKDSVNPDPNISVNAESMLTKLETVITSDINNYITAKVSEDENGFTRITLVDNTVDTKAIAYPKVWSQSFFTDSNIFKYNEEGVVVAQDNAKYRLDKIINRLNKIKTAFLNNKGVLDLDDRKVDFHIPANQEWLKDAIVSLFGSVGILIDKPTINSMLLSGDYGNPKLDQYSLLNSFVVSTVNYGGYSKIVSTLTAIKNAIKNDNTISDIKLNEDTIRPDRIWNNVGFIKELANRYAYVHATDKGLSSLGPDGNTYYMVSQNNFAKDRVNELLTDPELVANLSAVKYNEHSIILQAVKNGNTNLQVETFINFKDNTSYDVGRDYFGITDREDYLAKMSAIQNDRIIFPTVADKKTYHFIRGIKLPHEPINFIRYDNGSVLPLYGDEAIDILLGHCQDELNQVELCLRQIDDNPDHYDKEKNIHYNADGSINEDWLEPSRRIKNFHTPNKYNYVDNKGIKHTVELEGNGARFLFLNGIYTSEGFVDFNDPKKTAQQNLETAKQYFFNLSRETQKAFLSSIISKRVKGEIEKAKQLGLITSNANGDIWSLRNLLLDDAVINERSQRYLNIDSGNAEGYAIFDVLADYTINSIISVSEIEKMFSGAPAYYKVKYDRIGIADMSVDKIKRLGSITSTGLNNRLDFFNDPIRDEYTVAELKDHEIQDKQYDIYEGLFIRGSIKETIQQIEGKEAWDKVKDKSFNEIKEIYPEAVNYATQYAKKEVSGYKSGINVADAAVYISPDMTRDLLRMRGEWSPEVKKAFEILTNEDTADKWESDPKLYADANKVVLNAMKYVAFGTRLNEIPGLGIPYFNKMALFPLFKSIATGDIKALYDRMTDQNNPIDMIMFDSAVKAGSRSPMKAYRSAKDNEIELKDGQTTLSALLTDQLTSGEGNTLNDFNNLVTYKQKFRYIRQQLATDPHTHEEQMAGTQFMKVNLSNLEMDGMYGKEGEQVSGKQIKDTVMSALNELSDQGKQELQSELFTEDGQVNITKLGSMLERDARESDANDNVLSGLKTKNNAFVVPLSALSDNKWIESRFISMINKKIIDVHLPGGAFIQRSAFGLEATSANVVTPDMINNGTALKMYNEEGSMDSVVSINLFKHIIPDYKQMTFKQARKWLIDNNIIGQNATANAIGYRIPTQSIASISPLRFVDVFPEIMGDTIMLPEGFTKLTGSDFDIDKLYVARFEYDGSAKKLSLKNDILESYMKVLLTKDNFNSLKLSIDNATDNVKNVLKDIEGKNNKHYGPFEVYTPSYQEDRKAEYTGGKAGIGPFALNNAHHILTQLVGLKMESNPFTEAMKIVDLGRTYDYPINGKLGGRILDWLSAMINGFVDIAKDPYIVRLNVNGWTYNMVSFLLRTGKGKQTFYFMGQPILKEMANEVLKTKGKYGIDRTKTPSQLEREAINKILDKYDPQKSYRKEFAAINKDPKLAAMEYKDLFNTYITEDGVETSRTRELLLHPDSIKGFDREQIRIYYAWLALKPYADDLANLVKYSKVDTKKTGKTFAEQQVYYDGMMDLTINSKFGEGEVKRFYDETFIGKKTENSIPFGNSIFKNLLLRNTDMFSEQKNIVLSLLGRKGNANSKLLSSVISGMEAQIKSEFFNQYAVDNNIDIRGMFVGQNSMAKRINRFKLAILKGQPTVKHLLNADGTIANDFLNYIIPNISNTEEGLDFLDTSELLSADQAQANNLINYWRELIDDSNPNISKLFKDLAVYAFATSGDNASMNSFFQYLPNSYRKQMGYTEFVQGKLEQMVNASLQNYSGKDDLFLNNWTNDLLVKPVKMYQGDEKAPLYSISLNKDATIPNIIFGAIPGRDNVIAPINWINIPDGKGKKTAYPLFPPYIKINDNLGFNAENWHVYTIIGYRENFNVITNKIDYTPIYGLVSKKGYKKRGHTIVEYGRQTQFDFNKENEWNYTEALNNLEALYDMVDEYDRPMFEEGRIHVITDLPSYQGMNYAKAEQDRIFVEEYEDSDESTQDAVLEEKEESASNKPVSGVDLLGLYEEGNRRISSLLDELELTNEERQTYLNEFAEQLRNDNVNTNDQLEEAIRKFICNL